jgi:hypothetical protein
VKEVTTDAVDDVKKQKKIKHRKLKLLEKKYGQISRERYAEALHQLSLTTSPLTVNQKGHEQNIADLYILQNSHITETVLEPDSLEDTEDLEDLGDLEGCTTDS